MGRKPSCLTNGYVKMLTPNLWTAKDARAYLKTPDTTAHKYSRGVSCIIAGSNDYPGAAVLACDACLRTGTGMVRYIGPQSVRNLVLRNSPEVVTIQGRMDAVLLGPGIVAGDAETVLSGDQLPVFWSAVHEPIPAVVDAGALEWAVSLKGPTVMTPHAGELARLLQVDPTEVMASPERFALLASERFDCVVLLKGSTTWVCAKDHPSRTIPDASPWLATAGTGDVLAGILIALMTVNRGSVNDTSSLMGVAATGALLHAKAAELAEGPFTVRQLIEKIPFAFRHLQRS